MPASRLNLAQYSSGIIVPLLIVLIAVGGYLVILPKYKTVKEQSLALAGKRATLAGRQGEFKNVKDLVAEVKALANQLAVIDEAIPEAPRVPELLSNFDHLTKQSGLLISTLLLSPAPTFETVGAGQGVSQLEQAQSLFKQTERLAIIQVDVTMKGKYINLKTFLSNLEQNLRLMDILSLTFGPVDEESGLQEYILKIQTYYQKS